MVREQDLEFLAQVVLGRDTLDGAHALVEGADRAGGRQVFAHGGVAIVAIAKGPVHHAKAGVEHGFRGGHHEEQVATRANLGGHGADGAQANIERGHDEHVDAEHEVHRRKGMGLGAEVDLAEGDVGVLAAGDPGAFEEFFGQVAGLDPAKVAGEQRGEFADAAAQVGGGAGRCGVAGDKVLDQTAGVVVADAENFVLIVFGNRIPVGAIHVARGVRGGIGHQSGRGVVG